MQSSNEMASVAVCWALLGANYRKSMELGRFICHGMIDLWLWNNGVYGVGVGWFMRPGTVQLSVQTASQTF